MCTVWYIGKKRTKFQIMSKQDLSVKQFGDHTQKYVYILFWISVPSSFKQLYSVICPWRPDFHFQTKSKNYEDLY